MPQELARDAVRRLQADGAAIVEVLPKEEFDLEHLPGAINLPLDQLRPDSAERLLGADKRLPIVVYCQAID
jgi:rhodanese-related sulfurtransferase